MIRISLEYASLNKHTRNLIVSSEFLGGSFPREFEIESHHTGRVVRFVYDDKAAERNEWWDGEMAEYLPVGEVNINRAIVQHEW